MPAQLIALTDGPDILLDKPILLLGRHPECDIQIDSRKISRRHCCIAQVEDFLIVRDLGSTNGIRINGVRLQEGRLRPNDELTIGNSRYKVQWETIEGDRAALLREKAAPRPGRLEAIDDAVLESCEEPVPLEDSPEPLVPPGRPGAPPRPTQVEGDPDPADSLILPEHLELAPLSDIIPPPGSQQ
jgi:predicted component of type VI protein secretion system